VTLPMLDQQVEQDQQVQVHAPHIHFAHELNINMHWGNANAGPSFSGLRRRAAQSS
jgi:hypothetical protein